MIYWQLLLAACGITVTIVQGSIFSRLHARAEFFRCAMCVGWWAGTAVAFAACFIYAVPWREAVTLPPATALLAHLASQFASACWRVSAEPVPDTPTQSHETSELQRPPESQSDQSQ